MRHCLVVLAFSLLTACPQEDVECRVQGDCGATTETCDSCPPEGDALCLDGVCEDRGEDEASVVIDIMRIEPRQLEVTSIIHVLADMTGPTGPFTCAAAEAGDGSDLNVLASGYKNLEGGAQHLDINVGRVPGGSVGLLLLGKDDTAGEGNIIASGCVADIDITGGDVNLELVDLVER